MPWPAAGPWPRRADTSRDAALQQRYEADLAAERIREAGLRLLIGWGLGGGRQDAVRELLRLTNGLLAGQSREQYIPALVRLWQDLGGDRQSCSRWIAQRSEPWRGIALGAGTAVLTPALEGDIAGALAADRDGSFCRAPALSGKCYTTGLRPACQQPRMGRSISRGCLRLCSHR